MPKIDLKDKKKAYASEAGNIILQDLKSQADSMIGDFNVPEQQIRTLYGLLWVIKRFENFIKTENNNE